MRAGSDLDLIIVGHTHGWWVAEVRLLLLGGLVVKALGITGTR